MGEFIVGIDEVGRGPLAGPVFVGAVAVTRDFDWQSIKGVRDSKKLSPQQRKDWYLKIDSLRNSGELNFVVRSSPSEMIDAHGIVYSIQSALDACLLGLGAEPGTCEIRLDGTLHAPEHFPFQQTIIHGDDIEPIISMASIVAKVERDFLMGEFAIKYPKYGFESHKGYGTPAHCALIKKHGLCVLHRKSFCTRLEIKVSSFK
ncbi:MAG: ribonuclease HII [bacterium]|nr:ribonuclease HII [bacterium]